MVDPAVSARSPTRAVAVLVIALIAVLVGAAAFGVWQSHAVHASDEDGALPHGATVADAQHAGIRNLMSELRDALGAATSDAAVAGASIEIGSGWRSQAEQDALYADAVREYGSEEEAARWVLPASASAHVRGEAVDVGPDGADWLIVHGAAYGLCRIYENEWWHFELRPDAASVGCPAPLPDAAAG